MFGTVFNSSVIGFHQGILLVVRMLFFLISWSFLLLVENGNENSLEIRCGLKRECENGVDLKIERRNTFICGCLN